MRKRKALKDSRPKLRKGFAVMDKALGRRIARLGGRAVVRKLGKQWMRQIGSKGGKG